MGARGVVLMPATLKVIRGKPAVEIPDARGELWLYWFQVIPMGNPQAWRVDLTKLEGDQPVEAYRVTLFPDRWYCTCPHALYRRARCIPDNGCKHVLAARELKALLESLGVTA